MIRHIVGCFCALLALVSSGTGQVTVSPAGFRISEAGYFELQGVNVMLFDDFYPEGHQGGLTIVQAGERVAANGDLRLEPTPGQWSPVPKEGEKKIDRAAGTISVTLWYPDSSRNRKGFNPIDYPDLTLKYTVSVRAVSESIRVAVNLDGPLPERWGGRVGFNLELFPGRLFGGHYLMNGRPGIFPRQADGRVQAEAGGELQVMPLATGDDLVILPGDPDREMRIASARGPLRLIDGRGMYNNGWFVVRSTIPPGVAGDVVEWTIVPRHRPGWRYTPVVQVSQAGYHPRQSKCAVIELDKSAESFGPVELVRVSSAGETVIRREDNPRPWGTFLRYRYIRYDFSDVMQEGLYKVKYGDVESAQFVISRDVFARDVWQPTLEYFLPVQMCHMRINDRYKVWHGLCHMDDARMAPLNHVHFDGYAQGSSTLTRFRSGDHVPGMNVGGWHDAGDYDLRVESQAETVYKLALAYEYFHDDYDATTIDQGKHIVEMHRPDGKPDILQQVEHGVLSIVGGYENLGRLYRGMICPTLRQYVHLGDAATMSDNIVFSSEGTDPVMHEPLPEDDRWVFTEENPARELYVAQRLAAAGRVMSAFNPPLAARCLRIAKELYVKNPAAPLRLRLCAAAELYCTTSEKEYGVFLLANRDSIARGIGRFGEVIGRVNRKLNDTAFTRVMTGAVKKYIVGVRELEKSNPYGVPYEPHIWGAGWEIQSFGVNLLFLSLDFPDVVGSGEALNALNFVLGCHPGENTASFASGVGAKSLTVAYGANRDEWSYIPGGVASGTALIRPDLPELKTWPYFWQQTEYVMGGGATDFMLLAMAADHVLNR